MSKIWSTWVRVLDSESSTVMDGLINTFVTVCLNIILLTKLNMGIKGYFISIIISSLVEGTEAPLAPPEEVDQFVVEFEFPLPPLTKYLNAISYFCYF